MIGRSFEWSCELQTLAQLSGQPRRGCQARDGVPLFRRLLLSAVLAALALASGCASTLPLRNSASSGPLIGGLVLRNDSSQPTERVRVSVVGTHKFVSCGYILARSTCSTTFPFNRYQGRSVTIQWAQRGRAIGSAPFAVPLPNPLPKGRPLEVVIHFAGDNGIRSYMRQLRL